MARSYNISRPREAARLPGVEALAHFAAAFFAAAPLTDFAYVQTTVLMWRDFSSWLLLFGLVVGGVAVLLWLIGLALQRHRPVWGGIVLNLLVLLLAFVNSLVHAGDGWMAIVPWGLGLSVVTVLLMIGSAILQRSARTDPPVSGSSVANTRLRRA